jgi:hypothetical protein
MMLNPSGQTIFHAVPVVPVVGWRAFGAVAAMGALLLLAWHVRRTAWAASFGLLWFPLALVPSSALTVLDQGEPMAEHRVYLASIGFFVAVGIGLARLGPPLQGAGRRVGVVTAAALGLVPVALATQTIVRNAVWSDPIVLWRESVNLAPAHYRPRLLLGEALQDAGRRKEALDQFQTAIQLRPTEPLGHVKVGQCLAEVGRWEEARAHFLTAIDLDPHNRSARNSLAVLDHVESRFEGHGSRR